MEISGDTEEVLKFLDYITGNNLRKRADMAAILELGAAYKEDELINNLIFAGAILWNLSSTIRRSGPETQGTEKLHSEMQKSGAEFRDLLIRIRDLAPNDIKARLEDTYISITIGAFRNMIDLAHDLAELKNLQNTMKRKGKDD